MKALLEHLYSMKIKEQTRKLAAGFQNTVLRLQIELTWFEEIFEEYKKYWSIKVKSLDLF